MRSVTRFRRGVLLVAMAALVAGVVAAALQPVAAAVQPRVHASTATP